METKAIIEHPGATMGTRPRVLQVLTILLLLLYAAVAEAVPLASYNVDIKSTSVSGISSGGYMALQFAIAHSDIVTGAGVIAGGPYRCAAEGINTALDVCMKGAPDPQQAIAEIEVAAANGNIAPTENLDRQRLWLFSGYNDGVVRQTVMDSLYDSITHYALPSHVYYQDTLGAGHAMITEQRGMECQLTDAPFVNDCDYDAAGLLLQHIYGKLNTPAADLAGGAIVSFDQTAFTERQIHRAGLAKAGYAYVPQACAEQAACRVHVAFHGCRQYAGEVGDAFYANAGYNRWADNNRIIILYPQTQATSVVPFNPKGCWDWWGYTGEDFAYQSGAQINAVRAMLEQLSRGFRPDQIVAPQKPPQLAAIDASDDSVSLVWQPGQQSGAYYLYRAMGSRTQFERVNDNLQSGNSYVDHGLSPETSYSYRLGVVTDSGEIVGSGATGINTRSPPIDCDPYFSDNVTHASEGRANVWFGFVFASGSWDYMGLWNVFTETALVRDGDGFQVGVCVEEGS